MKSNSIHPLTVKLKLRRGSSAVQIGEMCGTGPTREHKATNGMLKKYPAFVGSGPLKLFGTRMQQEFAIEDRLCALGTRYRLLLLRTYLPRTL